MMMRWQNAAYTLRIHIAMTLLSCRSLLANGWRLPWDLLCLPFFLTGKGAVPAVPAGQPYESGTMLPPASSCSSRSHDGVVCSIDLDVDHIIMRSPRPNPQAVSS